MGLIPLSGLLRTAAAGVQGYGEDKDAAIKEALQQNALKRQGVNDAIDAALKAAQTRHANWQADVPLPGSSQAIAGKVAEANALIAPHAAGAAADASAVVAPHVAEATQVAPVHTKQAIDIAKGEIPIKATEAENAAAATEHHAAPTIVPTDKGVFRVPRQGVAEPVVDAKGQPVVKAAAGAGSGRGFGQGGPLGAASGLASVKEMHAAHPNLQTFEKGLVSEVPTNQLDALDRFRQRLANDLQTHGVITAAQSAEAERELAASNPDLAIYGRNLKQWIVSDMNLSRGGTDERARMDAAVSGLSIPLASMSPQQRSTYINQIWEGRMARLAGLDEAVPGMEAMLKRLAGPTGSIDAADHSQMSDADFAVAFKAGKFKKP